MTPAARWGHQAAFVPSQNSLYIIGGQVSSGTPQITNDVLILPLNATNPAFNYGSNVGLPPHAFAAMSLTENADSLIITGGMTSNCASDGTTHTFNFGTGAWSSTSPTRFVRRRNGGMAMINTGSSEGAMLVVGGIADPYSCATSTYTFPAADVLSLPMSTNSIISTRNLPTSLTGSELSVSDFAMTTGTDGTIYMAGGQASTGDLVPLSTIGTWSKSAGWTSQVTTGDIPVGRAGATLAAHPSLDILVLHGGDVSANDTNPTALLAFLNTTSWTWSTPSNLQPPTSSSVAYHTSIMTPSGVMITSFGMGNNGPRSDQYYLDLRDPSGSMWTWKSYWSPEMLEAYSSTTSTTSSTSVSTGHGGSKNEGKTITSIVVPILVGLLIIVPLAVLFIRRKIRIARKRRLARHFSFEEQEDSGDFTKPFKLTGSRQTKVEYPFGRDANEKEGSWWTDITMNVSELAKNLGSLGRRSENGSRGQNKHQRMNSRGMNWEEIDFGLDGGDNEKRGLIQQGKGHGISESRKSSFSATGSPTNREMDSIPGPGVASTNPFSDFNAVGPLLVTIHDDSPRLGTPTHDGQIALFPSVSIIPPTPIPSTPTGGQVTTVAPAPPTIDPSTGLDWNLLAQELEQKPAFRSISPSSTLRSHSHSSAPIPPAPKRNVGSPQVTRKPLPGPISVAGPPSPTYTFGISTPVQSSPVSPISPVKPIGPAPVLPTFEFQASSVDPRTGRRTSTSSVIGGGRAVSGPVANSSPSRQLTARRGSAPNIVISTAGVSSLDFGNKTGSPEEYRAGSLQGRRASRLRITNDIKSEESGDEDEDAVPRAI